MKKLLVLALVVAALTLLFTVVSAADTAPAGTAISASTAATATEAPSTATTSTSVQPSTAATQGTTATAGTTAVTGANVAIAPDSPLYPIKRMIESVQVALTFSPDAKAELLVSFANERLNEASLMTERNKQQLVQKVMEAYIKTIKAASEKTEEAAQAQKDVKPLLDSISISQDAAGNVVIKASGVIPADVAEQLKTSVSSQVKKTIAVQAAAEAKNQFKTANDQVKAAKKDLKLASEGGSEAMVKSAADELLKTQQARDKAQELKKQAEAFKGQINESLKQVEGKTGIEEQDKDDEHDKDMEKQGKGHEKLKAGHGNKAAKAHEGKDDEDQNENVD